VKTFNLHPGVADTSKMREAIAFALFREAGVPAPRTAYAELFFTVPGIYTNTPGGLFTLIEDVNNTFLERALPPGDGLLMKPEGTPGGIQVLGATWNDYTGRLRPDRDATPREQRRVMDFAGLISQPDVALFRSRIGDYLDVELFLRFVAVNALIANTDSYLGGSHNYYLYLDPRDDKFRFLPWDQDLSMGTNAFAGRTTNVSSGPDLLRPWRGDNPLIYWLLDDPGVNARYRAILKELGTAVFTEPRLLALVDTLEKIGTGRGPAPREFIEARTAYVRDVISKLD
jgi:spore coat protein CotH